MMNGNRKEREHWRDYAYQASRYNCEKDCPHLVVSGPGNGDDEAYCKYYHEKLAHDGSKYGEWFMCGDCVDDSYGESK